MFSPTTSHPQTRKSNSASSRGSPGLGRKQQAQSNLTQKLRMMDLALDWQERRQVVSSNFRSPEVHRSQPGLESRWARESPPGAMQAAQASTRLRRAQSAAPTMEARDTFHSSPINSLQVQLELERFAGEAAATSSCQAKPEAGSAAHSEEEHCTDSSGVAHRSFLKGIWKRLGQLEASWQDAHAALGAKLSAEVRETQRAQEAKAASNLSTFELELTTALEERSREADMLLEKRLIDMAESLQERLAAVEGSLSDDRQRIEKLEQDAAAEGLPVQGSSLHATADKLLHDVGAQVDAQLSAMQRELEARAEDASTKCDKVFDRVAAKLSELDGTIQICTKSTKDQELQSGLLQMLDADMQQMRRHLADVADSIAPSAQSKAEQTKGRVAEDMDGWRRTWDLQLAALCSRLDAMETRHAAEMPRVVEAQLRGMEDKLNRQLQQLRGEVGNAEPPWEPPLRALGHELKALLAEQAEDSANALRSMSRIVRELRLSVMQAQPEGTQDIHAITAN
mmetsp:Transcript_45802/g.106403  ORF Transcript_45802/g.106403 Transcript_45802/m.106403 type:complete len:511 (+) Transcript_45802:78-1610(+)